jgi:CheY-like chemotaxis protein
MHGKIWVNSEFGKGSDFHFTIKTRYSTPQEDINPLYKTLQNLTGKSVLIVDDNATNRKVLTLQCEYWGLKTLALESGGEALSVLAKQKFDIAILDMQMPEMDGIMLANRIRDKFTKEQLPLIMLTSVGFSRESDELGRLFSYFVNKPIKHSQLAEILLKVIGPPKKAEMDNVTRNEDFAQTAVKFPFRILVAEDNLINQKLIRNIFELLGYKIDIAANGLEVLEALKRKIYDLIFMDIQMPEMNGYETTRIIISHRNMNRPIIIAMTANAMQGDREKCFEVGMDDYVTKPMRVDNLIKVLHNWGDKKFPNNLYI